jgi:hypothetical protein
MLQRNRRYSKRGAWSLRNGLTGNPAHQLFLARDARYCFAPELRSIALAGLSSGTSGG